VCFTTFTRYLWFYTIYAKAPVQPVNPFYTGSGGKGISLAILAPKATGVERG
jgi:hypothetical protein